MTTTDRYNPPRPPVDRYELTPDQQSVVDDIWALWPYLSFVARLRWAATHPGSCRETGCGR